MRPLFGPRTVVEAAFLVAVPVIALEAGLGWPAIVGAGALGYVIVLAVEAAVWRGGRREPQPEAAPVPAAPDSDHVRVIRAEAPPAVWKPVPEREPEPVAAAAPAEPPRLVPAPAPSPPPEPAPPPHEPEPVPAATVVPIPAATAARQWNVWDLERLAREHAGGDPIADEERTFLLMYLRDFAGPDGLLPVDFDDLVRQSFGALVADR